MGSWRILGSNTTTATAGDSNSNNPRSTMTSAEAAEVQIRCCKYLPSSPQCSRWSGDTARASTNTSRNQRTTTNSSSSSSSNNSSSSRGRRCSSGSEKALCEWTTRKEKSLLKGTSKCVDYKKGPWFDWSSVRETVVRNTFLLLLLLCTTTIWCWYCLDSHDLVIRKKYQPIYAYMPCTTAVRTYLPTDVRVRAVTNPGRR